MHKYIELFPENLTFEEINLGGRNVKYSKIKKGGKTGMRIRACLNFAQVNFANCFRGCFSDFMRRIAGYLTNKNLENRPETNEKEPDRILLYWKI